MPVKYSIHPHEALPRFKPIIRSGIIAWEEGCLKCAVCVKKRCVYKVYDQRQLDGRQMLDSIDVLCKDCYRCVQGCPARLINKALSPSYSQIGDDLFTPEVIVKTWAQATTGKIPVSGAGYGGVFSGNGFDSMWTDMSEIVRPTRDGIHGREYISTGVDLGRKELYLSISRDGSCKLPSHPTVKLELPVLFKTPSFGAVKKPFFAGIAAAAKKLLTQAIIPAAMIDKTFNPYLAHVIPSLNAKTRLNPALLKKVSLVELSDHKDVMKQMAAVKKAAPKSAVIIRVALNRKSAARCLQLARAGAGILHLEGLDSGREKEPKNGRYLKDVITEVHFALVTASVRDTVRLIFSGGMAMAEHVAKSIICGADAVAADLALLVGVECMLCRGCEKGLSCPVSLEDVESGWTTQRIINLMCAWHNQLLEISGAMGIRDIRRIRGERGRAMFFEDLERQTFAALGNKIAGK